MEFENQFAKISKNYFILPNVAKAPIHTFNFTIPTEKISLHEIHGQDEIYAY